MRKRASTALGAALLALAAGAQPSAGALRQFEVQRGVIADEGCGAVYIAGPNGGIDALDVTSGRTLWTSPAAALPLAARGSLLAAQGEDPRPAPRLRIVVLDTTRGRIAAESVTDLPKRASASIVDTPRHSFRATARYETDAFVVSWIDRETLAGGVAPPPGQAPAVRVLEGTTRVAVPPTASAMETANDAPCVHATVAGARGEAVTLKRSDACSGRDLPDVVLTKSALVALPSADGAHVLVSDREGPEYRWTIFATATGEKAGELRRDVSAAPFFVTRGLIVFASQPHGFVRGDQAIEVPLELGAVRLSSGEEVWHRAMRDLQWRGPAPPREKSK